jgi:hypothetical protein
MGASVSCVYHAYEDGRVAATGRLTLDEVPREGEELRLNGRVLVVREVAFSGGSHVLTLEPRGS